MNHLYFLAKKLTLTDFFEEINNNHMTSYMYQNKRKFSSIKLHFDDDGNLDTIKNKDFYTEDVEKEKKAQAATNPIEAGKKEVNPIQEKLNALLGDSNDSLLNALFCSDESK